MYICMILQNARRAFRGDRPPNHIAHRLRLFFIESASGQRQIIAGRY